MNWQTKPKNHPLQIKVHDHYVFNKDGPFFCNEDWFIKLCELTFDEKNEFKPYLSLNLWRIKALLKNILKLTIIFAFNFHNINFSI